MLYEKKVKYLDYYEGGARVRGGGFVKLEVRDGTLRMELSVTGLHRTDTFARDVMLCGRDREEVCGKIEISAGRGQYRQLWRNLGNIGGTGIGYGELCGFRIPLGAGREVSCRWQQGEGTARREPDGIGRKAAEAARLGTGKAGKKEVWRETAGAEQPEIGKEAREERVEDEKRQEIMAVGYRREIPEEEVRVHREEKYERNLPIEEAMPESVFQGEIRGEDESGNMAADRDVEGREDAMSLAVGEKLTGGDGMIGTFVSAKSAGEKTVWDDGQKNASRKGNGSTERMASGEVVKASRDDRGKKLSVEWESRENDRGRASAKTSAKPTERPVRLMEEKWQQLWAIYPHIRPFQDGREYLSIGPADFVLFPEGCYKAVNNSFLLHGYYNYHHLLLARVERKGECSYYIGVPGNFYEKEKQVAIMFGFESFECAEEPAQAGDFGYYMMRTQI